VGADPPGTDGALLLAIIHEIIATGLYDREFLVQYTNAGQLVNQDEASDEFGMFVRTEVPTEEACYEPQDKLWWDRTRPRGGHHTEGADPFLLGEFKLPDGTPVKPAFQLLQERVKDYTPEWAEGITGIPAETIRRLAHEMGVTARDQKIELPIAWTDSWGKEHDTVTGNPVAFHAMRGLAAHSNGFQTIRALAILMSLLGTIDRPGGFRHKAPFPRPIPPCARTPNDPRRSAQHAAGRHGAGLAGRPGRPVRQRRRQPVRIDKAFSWEYPLSVHGLMHNVITNAWRGDPYRIDTLLIFMANMAWNSTMNTVEVRKMLNDKDENGRVQDPLPGRLRRLPVGDDGLRRPDPARHHLPRTARRDVHARPADLEFDGPVDSVRIPVVPPTGECKPFQEVLIELARASSCRPSSRRTAAQVPRLSRLHRQLGNRARLRHRLPRRLARQGRREIAARRTQPQPVGDVREEQLRLPLRAAEVLPVHAQLEPWATWNGRSATGITRYAEPILIHIYSEVLQRFRLAAQGKGFSAQPPDHLRQRIETYFDPLPFYYEPLEAQAPTSTVPAGAVTQRPMAMYHSWDSQNAWLRQIHTHNYLHVNPKTASVGASRTATGSGSSRNGARCAAWPPLEAVEPGTVWTWNAIGKAAGAWNLTPDANESQRASCSTT
jgi:anaerobic selenocysteine-containing dehydrogenase